MRKVIALMVISTTLSGCLGLGSSDTQPDEMMVVENAPLTLPPSFELRPPRQGQSPAVVNSNKKVEKLVLGETKETSKASTDNWLLEKAGYSKRNKSIREIMAEEANPTKQETKKKGWFESMFSSDKNKGPSLEELAEASKKTTK